MTRSYRLAEERRTVRNPLAEFFSDDADYDHLHELFHRDFELFGNVRRFVYHPVVEPGAFLMHEIPLATRPDKVIGVGFHKTGTKTLGLCLEMLGFRNCSLDREAFALWRLGEIDAVLEMMTQADSFEDWPWPFLYRVARERFPHARFVLTTRRDEATWLESLTQHVARHGRTSFNYRKYIYGVDDPEAHPQRFLDVYRAHNAAVRDFFAAEPGRLLEICWEDGHGWERLCGFLGLPIPDAPLPHMNRRRPAGDDS